MPRYSLAPISLSVFRRASATPTASAGRARGRLMSRINLPQSRTEARGASVEIALCSETSPVRPIRRKDRAQTRSQKLRRRGIGLAETSSPVRARQPNSPRNARLQRTSRIKYIHIDVGRDVDRNSERQWQHPHQNITAGKLKRAHQPGSRNAGDSGSHGNAKQQQHRLQQCYGQHIGGEVRPEIQRHQLLPDAPDLRAETPQPPPPQWRSETPAI